jgi:hypothetical protein
MVLFYDAVFVLGSKIINIRCPKKHFSKTFIAIKIKMSGVYSKIRILARDLSKPRVH